MKEVKSQLEFLGRHNIACVIIGGVAGALHGAAIPITDLDVCYSRSPDNLTRMAAALQSVNARLRNAPPNFPFLLDAETLRKGLNFTFITDVGDLDLLGEVRGIGCFEMVAEGAPSFEVLLRVQSNRTRETNFGETNCWPLRNSKPFWRAKTGWRNSDQIRDPD